MNTSPNDIAFVCFGFVFSLSLSLSHTKIYWTTCSSFIALNDAIIGYIAICCCSFVSLSVCVICGLWNKYILNFLYWFSRTENCHSKLISINEFLFLKCFAASDRITLIRCVFCGCQFIVSKCSVYVQLTGRGQSILSLLFQKYRKFGINNAGGICSCGQNY